jgi:hypothetical protein
MRLPIIGSFPAWTLDRTAYPFLQRGGPARKYIESLEVVHLAIIVRDEAFLAMRLFDHS